jgi:hypothetical protein
MKLENVMVGSDPEVFVVKGNKIVPSFDLVGGSKFNPRPLGDGFFVQEDNVALEYNVPPARTKEEFAAYIFGGLDKAKAVLPAGHDIKVLSSHRFDPEQLKHWRASIFGCEGTQNAWLNGDWNPKPDVPTDGLRCTGGHVHVGYKFDGDNREVNNTIIKWMDILLAVPSLAIDKDTDRRKLYGKAGEFREKSYGVEHRTLSSFWLQSKELVEWVFSQTMKAVDKVNEGLVPDAEDELLVPTAINNQEQKAIDRILDKYEVTI